MKPKLSTVAFCVSAIALLIYLLFANPIVGFFASSNIRKIDALPQREDKVYSVAESLSFQSDDGLPDFFILTGWGFCETKEDNANREFFVIFANDKNIYSLEIGKDYQETRMDVKNAYATLFIPSADVGFDRVLVSTIGMKNGIYDMYFYCKENETNSGIINTGVQLEKTSSGIRQNE